MRAKGCGTTPVPRLPRGRASPPAPGGGDAAPSLDGSRVALLGSPSALVPFAPFRFLAFRAAASVPSAPARASLGTTAERQGEFGASTPGRRPAGPGREAWRSSTRRPGAQEPRPAVDRTPDLPRVASLAAAPPRRATPTRIGARSTAPASDTGSPRHVESLTPGLLRVALVAGRPPPRATPSSPHARSTAPTSDPGLLLCPVRPSLP